MFSQACWSRNQRLRLRICLAISSFVSAVAAGSGLNAAVAQQEALPSPWQHKPVSLTILQDQTIPKIDHGYIIFSRHIIVDTNQREAIYVQSLADGTVRRPSFWLKDSLRVWVNDLAVASSDEILVVGSFTRSKDGAAINFLVKSDMEGQTLAIIDMGTYEPELTCVAQDGSVWTFGQDWGAERSDIPYFLLRNYSSRGRLLGSYLSSDALPPIRLNFSTRLHRMGGARGRMFLQCGQQSVGAYIGPASRWVEIDLADSSERVWQVEPPSRAIMTGLALLKRHEVYCSYRAQNTVFVRGFFKLNLTQPKIATWEPIPGMVQYVDLAHSPAPPMSVIGADGSSLVYQKMDFKTHVFYWVRP
jgi:hypothetical protein